MTNPVSCFFPIRTIAHSIGTQLPAVTYDENHPPQVYLMQMIHDLRRNLPPLTSDAAPFQAAKREEDTHVPSSLMIQNLLASQAEHLAAKANSGAAPDLFLFCQKLPYAQKPPLQTPQDAICYLLDMATRKKLKMTRPDWIFEWLNRHQSAFVEKPMLQTLFALLGTAAGQGWLPRPDAAILSSLVARLCLNAENHASFAIPFSCICILINLYQHTQESPLLDEEARSLFVSALLKQTSLQQMLTHTQQLIFKALKTLAKQNLLRTLNPEEADCLASMIVSVHQKRGRVPLITNKIAIPGLLDSLLMQGGLPGEELLFLCCIWSHPKTILSDPAREKLLALLKERAQTIPSNLSSEQILKERISILDALATFTTIVQDAGLSPLSEEELLAIRQLLEKLHALSPETNEIEDAMMAIWDLTKTHPVKQLRPLENSLFSLLEYAATHTASMSCLRRATYTYRIIKGFTDGDGPSPTRKIVPQALLRHLALLASPSSEELSDDIRIAASFHLAGLYCDLTEGEDGSEILEVFRALADQLDPSHCHAHFSWNDLISLLCSQFAQFPSTPHAINHFLFGLATLALHAHFTGFRQGAGVSLDLVLEKYVSAAENPEEEIACEVTADTLIWISHLAEQRLLSKQISFDALIKFIPEDAQHRILLSTILSLGKLAANGGAPLLSTEGNRHLHRLVCKTLEEVCEESLKTCPDLLYALGWLINSRVISQEQASLHEPFFRRIIKNALEDHNGPIKNAKQACQLLFFIDALPDCKPGHALQKLRQQLQRYLLDRQLEGPRASFKRKRSEPFSL